MTTMQLTRDIGQSDLAVLKDQRHRLTFEGSPDLWILSTDPSVDSLVEKICDARSSYVLRYPASRVPADGDGAIDDLLAYATQELGVERIIVCCPADCSAVRTAAPTLGGNSGADSPYNASMSFNGTNGVAQSGTLTKPGDVVLNRIKRRIQRRDDTVQQVRRHLREQVNEIAGQSSLRRAIEAGELVVEGLLYFPESGAAEAVSMDVANE